jgi:hypothetical protein
MTVAPATPRPTVIDRLAATTATSATARANADPDRAAPRETQNLLVDRLHVTAARPNATTLTDPVKVDRPRTSRHERRGRTMVTEQNALHTHRAPTLATTRRRGTDDQACHRATVRPVELVRHDPGS